MASLFSYDIIWCVEEYWLLQNYADTIDFLYTYYISIYIIIGIFSNFRCVFLQIRKSSPCYAIERGATPSIPLNYRRYAISKESKTAMATLVIGNHLADDDHIEDDGDNNNNNYIDVVVRWKDVYSAQAHVEYFPYLIIVCTIDVIICSIIEPICCFCYNYYYSYYSCNINTYLHVCVAVCFFCSNIGVTNTVLRRTISLLLPWPNWMMMLFSTQLILAC